MSHKCFFHVNDRSANCTVAVTNTQTKKRMSIAAFVDLDVDAADTVESSSTRRSTALSLIPLPLPAPRTSSPRRIAAAAVDPPRPPVAPSPVADTPAQRAFAVHHLL